MSSKLKALGLGVLVLLAVGAFAAMNAGANTGGHFVSDSPTGKTIITGTEDGVGGEGKHTTELGIPGLTPIACNHSTYIGTMASNTVTSITIEPIYTGCATTNTTPGSITVSMNGCDYDFTIGKKASEDNTVDLTCPQGKVIELKHGSSCTIQIPPAEGIKGVSYDTIVLNEKHALTMTVTASGFKLNFEAGFCVLLGTSHEGELTGSVTVEGFADEDGTEGEVVDITAVGAEEL